MEQKGQHGSMTEVLARVNYYESVLGNPTKDPREARDSLYEEIGRLGAFVTDGVSDQDFKRLNQQVDNLSAPEREKVNSMIGELREKASRKQIGEGDAIALLTDPNSQQTIVIKIPSRK